MAVSDRDAGNHNKQGVPKYVDNLAKTNQQMFSPQAITGQYMLDMNNLGQMVDTGNKSNKLTNIGAGTPQPPTLDSISAKNKTVLENHHNNYCLLYTSPSPRDRTRSRMPSSA